MKYAVDAAHPSGGRPGGASRQRDRDLVSAYPVVVVGWGYPAAQEIGGGRQQPDRIVWGRPF